MSAAVKTAAGQVDLRGERGLELIHRQQLGSTNSSQLRSFDGESVTKIWWSYEDFAMSSAQPGAAATTAAFQAGLMLAPRPDLMVRQQLGSTNGSQLMSGSGARVNQLMLDEMVTGSLQVISAIASAFPSVWSDHIFSMTLTFVEDHDFNPTIGLATNLLKLGQQMVPNLESLEALGAWKYRQVRLA